MRDDLPRFPTPLEAFGKTSQGPGAAAYNARPPPQQYRHTSAGSDYHSTASLPDSISQSRSSSAGRVLHQHQYAASQPMLPQQTGQSQTVPRQSHRAQPPPRVPVNQYRPLQHSQSQPQLQHEQYQPASYQRQPPVPPKIPAQSFTPPPQTAPQQQQQQYYAQSTYPASPRVGGLTSAATPAADESVRIDLRALFDDVDRHKRGYLSEHELSKALVNGDYTLFDAHTVRLMMKMFDRDGDGCIYFAEFGQLWKYLHDWRGVFERFDTDKTDTISIDEFSRALKAFGYNLSVGCIEFMFNAGSKLNRQGQREMSFDLFVQSCISIKSITDTFKKYDTDRDGYVTMGFEDYLIETTKLH